MQESHQHVYTFPSLIKSINTHINTISQSPMMTLKSMGLSPDQFTHILVSLVEEGNWGFKASKKEVKVTFPLIHKEPQVLTLQSIWQEWKQTALYLHGSLCPHGQNNGTCTNLLHREAPSQMFSGDMSYLPGDRYCFWTGNTAGKARMNWKKEAHF